MVQPVSGEKFEAVSFNVTVTLASIVVAKPIQLTT
jgi:hypothetical protein